MTQQEIFERYVEIGSKLNQMKGYFKDDFQSLINSGDTTPLEIGDDFRKAFSNDMDEIKDELRILTQQSQLCIYHARKLVKE